MTSPKSKLAGGERAEIYLWQRKTTDGPPPAPVRVDPPGVPWFLSGQATMAREKAATDAWRAARQ